MIKQDNTPKILDTPAKRREWERTAEQIKQCKTSISYYKRDMSKIAKIIQKKEAELKRLRQYREYLAKYGLPRMKEHIGYQTFEEEEWKKI